MTTRQRLETELKLLRFEYKKADKERKIELFNRAEEIKILLKNLCTQCEQEPRKYNDYFCSKECNDKYYEPIEKKEIHSISYMQKELLKMGRKHKRDDLIKAS